MLALTRLFLGKFFTNSDKVHNEMQLIHLQRNAPKQPIRLNPIDCQDINIDLNSVKKWSSNNVELYQMILNNGMANFICNEQFIFQFYSILQFNKKNIAFIDSQSKNFSCLKVLNLVQNKISILENLPLTLQQLYIDFNQLKQCKLKQKLKLELLSISHNYICDSALCQMLKYTPELRCLNIRYNRISDIKQLVCSVKQCCKLQILSCNYNAISLLKYYYRYITQQLQLKYLDNEKYIKYQQPSKKVQIIIEKKIEQEKDNKKDNKKNNKKQIKKDNKIQEKQKKQEIVELKQQQVEVIKQLTQENFKIVKIKIIITNLEGISGNIYESNIFSLEDVKLEQIQSIFWLKYTLMGETIQLKQQIIRFDTLDTTNSQEIRANFNCIISKQIPIKNTPLLEQQGLYIEVIKRQPIVTMNENQQLVPSLIDNMIQFKIQNIGGIFVEFKQLHCMKEKSFQAKYRLFSSEALWNPLFRYGLLNQQQMINSLKEEFQQKMKQIEIQKHKKQQQEMNQKNQKKGGKDNTKKVVQKKNNPNNKKQNNNAIQKQKVNQCNYPIKGQQYRYLGNKQGLCKCCKQYIAIQVKID